MASTLQERIAEALSRVRHPRTGTDVLTSEVVRDIATTTSGRVRLTLLLAPGDDPILARTVRQTLEKVDGVTEATVDVADAPSAPAPAERKAGGRSLPVMTPPAAPARASAPTPVPAPNLGRIIAVSSGKGGVGKSTVAVNVAVALARGGARVGLMDADIYGPNMPRMMGVNEPPMVINERIVPLEAHGVKMISIGLLDRSRSAGDLARPDHHENHNTVSARRRLGPARLFHRRHAARHRRRAALARAGDAGLRRDHRDDAAGGRRSATRCAASRCSSGSSVPVIGIVENMSWFECPHCGKPSPIFGSGGGERLAKEVELPLLAQVPLAPRVMEGGDRGTPIIVSDPDSSAARALAGIAERITEWAGAAAGR